MARSSRKTFVARSSLIGQRMKHERQSRIEHIMKQVSGRGFDRKPLQTTAAAGGCTESVAGRIPSPGPSRLLKPQLQLAVRGKCKTFSLPAMPLLPRHVFGHLAASFRLAADNRLR